MSVNRLYDWVSQSIADSEGYVGPSMEYVNSCIAFDKRDLLKIIRAISDPTFANTLETFFKDPSNSISSVRVFPFAIPVEDRVSIVKYLGTRIPSGDYYCQGRRVDESFYQTVTCIYDRQGYPPSRSAKWYELNGYRRITVWLPFYGEVELQPNDIANKNIKVFYSISLTGELVYYITKEDSFVTPSVTEYFDVIIGKYSTNVAVEIPIGSTNQHAINRDLIIKGLEAAVQIAGSIAIGLTGGVTAVSTASSSSVKTIAASTISQTRSSAPYSRLKTTGKIDSEFTVSESSRSSRVYSESPSRRVIETCQGVANNAIASANNFYARGSSEITKNVTLEQFGPRYVIISYYDSILVDDGHAHFVGLPCCKRDTVGNFSGFTKLSGFRLEDFSLDAAVPTMKELELLEDVLINGFIINSSTEV